MHGIHHHGMSYLTIHGKDVIVNVIVNSVSLLVAVAEAVQAPSCTQHSSQSADVLQHDSGRPDSDMYKQHNSEIPPVSFLDRAVLAFHMKCLVCVESPHLPFRGRS